MSSKNKNANINDATVYDIDNLINNVFEFQFRMLGEATIGYFIQDFLIRHATKVEPYAIYHSQLYFEQMHLIIFKILLDDSGKSSITFSGLLNVLIKRKDKPEIESNLKQLRTDLNDNVKNRYADLLEHIRLFRNKIIGHLVLVQIKEKPILKNKSNDVSGDFVPMFQQLINYYVDLVELWGGKTDIRKYANIDFEVKKRLRLE